MQNGRKFGLYKLISRLNNLSLTNEEILQQKLLKKRNTFNICIINEAKEILNNADIVEKMEP